MTGENALDLVELASRVANDLLPIASAVASGASEAVGSQLGKDLWNRLKADLLPSIEEENATLTFDDLAAVIYAVLDGNRELASEINSVYTTTRTQSISQWGSGNAALLGDVSESDVRITGA